MNDDPLKNWRLQETALQRAARELQPLQSILADQERLGRIFDTYRGVLEEATRTSRLIDQAIVPNAIHDLIARTPLAGVAFSNIAEKFRLPEMEALAELQSSLAQPSIAEAISRYSLKVDMVSRAMADMKSPWLDFHNQIGSISALTELHGIGHVLATMPSFDDHVTAALRLDLGDWRGPLAVDPSGLLDQVTRSEFYVARGFDPGLTAFPVQAFRDGLASAGLYDAREQTNGEIDEEDADAAFMRTNEAHDRLMRFEYRLRVFIDEVMTLDVGPDWIKHRVPEPMRTAWTDKKNRGLAAGEAEQPLIAYADFTDYLAIIIRKDNWRDVFGAMFQHKPSVEESFRRLYPVRICTMHARPITQDDALFLLVEIKRLSKAMGFS
ncbi:MAG: hypothetical protein IBX58_15120 [Roseovarius sp.]|nr:hypothetical protein [Roseovarius sp.]